MVLQDAEIVKRLVAEKEEERIVITPLVDPISQVGPSSIDVRLGTNFKVPTTSHLHRSIRITATQSRLTWLGGNQLRRQFFSPYGRVRASGSLLRTPRPARPRSAELLSYQAYRPDSADSILYYPI